jgi:hypothetical protein
MSKVLSGLQVALVALSAHNGKVVAVLGVVQSVATHVLR